MRLRYDRIRVQPSAARERDASSNYQNTLLYDLNVILNVVNSLYSFFYNRDLWICNNLPYKMRQNFFVNAFSSKIRVHNQVKKTTTGVDCYHSHYIIY